MKEGIKIDIYYRDLNKKVHYIHSTNWYKLVRDAVESTHKYLSNIEYYNAESKKIGEPIILARIFGRKA